MEPTIQPDRAPHHEAEPQPSRTAAPQRRLSPTVTIVAGLASCSSGIALVIHILTGSPLWLALGAIALFGALAVIVVTAAEPGSLRRLGELIGRGVIVGAIGTVAYDASRWLLVQAGHLSISPFEALPLFGQAMIGSDQSEAAVTAVGVGYHILNGVTFGVAYVILLGNRAWWWGVVFALGLEAFMLALYPGWLDPRSVAELTQVSMVGHVAYGAALGLSNRALRRRSRLNSGGRHGAH